MLDAVTLDQLRTFVAVVDEGSFSAAGRKLQRVQSAVSHAMASLEAQLGVTIWDRSTKIPKLTEQGRVLLAAARRVCAEADELRRKAEGLIGGLEPRVSICVDQIFPLRALCDLCLEFARAFSSVELCLHTETLSAVSARVEDGTCQLGVVGPAAKANGLTRHHLANVRMVPVVSRDHPLASLALREGRVASERLSEHTQIVLSERGDGGGPDQAVLSARTWRIADLSTKHELLRAGLGWGNLPEHMAEEDLQAGRLVRLRPEAWDEDGIALGLAIVHRPGLAMGPATSWLMTRMKELCELRLRKEAPDARPVSSRRTPARAGRP
jgi:DNA-binding transcriptional LysR family regulator